MFSDKVIPSYYATYHIKKNSQKMMNKLITKICKVLFQGENQRQKVEIVNNDNIICCETLLQLTGDDVVLLFLFFAIVFFFSILYRCDASKIITLDPLTGNDKYGIINFQSRVSGYKKMVENNQRILFTWRYPRPRFCLPSALHMTHDGSIPHIFGLNQPRYVTSVQGQQQQDQPTFPRLQGKLFTTGKKSPKVI